VTTVVYAVDAQYAFIKPDFGGGVAGAFAVIFTNATVGTFSTNFADPPQGKTAQYPKKRSCGTYETAVKAGNHQI
jgi:hypothetical protein